MCVEFRCVWRVGLGNVSLGKRVWTRAGGLGGGVWTGEEVVCRIQVVTPQILTVCPVCGHCPGAQVGRRRAMPQVLQMKKWEWMCGDSPCLTE